jgi:hypothetical protein
MKYGYLVFSIAVDLFKVKLNNWDIADVLMQWDNINSYKPNWEGLQSIPLQI